MKSCSIPKGSKLVSTKCSKVLEAVVYPKSVFKGGAGYYIRKIGSEKAITPFAASRITGITKNYVHNLRSLAQKEMML